MTTTYEGFIDTIKALGDVNWTTRPRGASWRSSRDEKPEKEYWVYCEWATGGMSGGSCWGGVAEPYVSGDAPQDLDSLDIILEAVAPNLTFLQYKNISRDVVETFEHSDGGDYYGNHTNYVGKQCNLRKLYDALVARGVFP